MQIERFVGFDNMDPLGIIHSTPKLMKEFFSELKNSKNIFVDAGLNIFLKINKWMNEWMNK